MDEAGYVARVGDAAARPAPGAFGGRAEDLGGRHAVPGLVDAHAHLVMGGFFLADLDLRAARTPEQFREAVQAAAAGKAAGEWVVGGGWDQFRWGGELPAAAWIDGFSRDVPVLLARVDGHMALANTRALELAGVLALAGDPPGGEIDRDAAGAPTGILEDTAIRLVRKQMPARSDEERREAVERACRHALARGVTLVHDMGQPAMTPEDRTAWDDLHRVLLPLADAGRLPLRVAAHVPVHVHAELEAFVAAAGQVHPLGRLSWGGLKEFADGSLGSSTALMYEPYADGGGTGGGGEGGAGLRIADPEVLAAQAVEADAAGLQLAVHAIGDRAVDEVVALYERVIRHNGRQTRRHRIEHVQHIAGPATAARMAASGIFAVANPQHLLDDAKILLRKLGPERAGPRRSYAYATLLAAGVPLAFGSDWPLVSDIAPLEALEAAAERVPYGGREPWAPEERISRERALRALTRGGAEAAFREAEVGSLKVGHKADLAVLDRDPLRHGAAPPRVARTYVDGALAFVDSEL